MMKEFKKLTMTLALLMTAATGEWADTWTQPGQDFKETSTIAADVEYYLYNVDTDAWFAAGNNNWTAAVVYKSGDENLSAEGMEYGFKFKFTDKQADGSYHIYHYYGPSGKLSSVNGKWFYLYDRNDGVFLTNNDSGDTYWTIEFQEDGTFTFKSSKATYGANCVDLITQDGTHLCILCHPADDDRHRSRRHPSRQGQREGRQYRAAHRPARAYQHEHEGCDMVIIGYERCHG